ncbi:MAG: hypothetical protein ABL931_22620 [Usitatibacteraceae bacterium]
MRRIAHRILSAAPIVAPAFAGVWATAEPAKAKDLFEKATLMMSDERFFWLCLALISGYALLWWLTSLEPTSRREKLKKGLRPLYAETATILSKLKRIENDDQLRIALKETDTHQQGVVDWLEANMGQAAVRKFLTINRTSHSYIWAGNHDPILANRRDQYLDALHGRVENLDCLLESDSWDGPQPSIWQRLMKVIHCEKP